MEMLRRIAARWNLLVIVLHQLNPRQEEWKAPASATSPSTKPRACASSQTCEAGGPRALQARDLEPRNGLLRIWGRERFEGHLHRATPGGWPRVDSGGRPGGEPGRRRGLGTRDRGERAVPFIGRRGCTAGPRTGRVGRGTLSSSTESARSKSVNLSKRSTASNGRLRRFPTLT